MPTIRYLDSVQSVRPEQLEELRADWPRPPSAATALESLRNMNAVILALDEEADRIAGFVCGMTDHTLILYIWDVEVLPRYRGQHLEREMLRRLLDTHEMYQVNTICIPEHRATFEQLGFRTYDPERHGAAMTKMRMDWQDGGPRAVS